MLLLIDFEKNILKTGYILATKFLETTDFLPKII